jgi:protein required for attachment to host cells
VTKTLRTWVVTADAARAHLFIHRDPADGLISADLPGLPAAKDRIQSHTEKSDRPGRSYSSSRDGVRHSVESHSDYRKLEKHKFTVAVAAALNHAALAKEFDQLVLVAPPRSVGEFRKCLSDEVQTRMRIVAKDLTKVPFAQIRDEVAELVRHSQSN